MLKQGALPNEIGTVLFDLDGTLTDSAEGILNCVVYALESLGADVPAREELMPFIGPPLTYSFSQFIGLGEEDTARAVKKYRERYSVVGLFENRVYGGIPEMLTRLRENGVRLAVATSKPEEYSLRIIRRFGLEEYFETVCGSGLDGSRDTKAEVIAEAMRRLGADAEHTVMVGDRKQDAIGAREEGLGCIGAGWGFAEEGELDANGVLCIAESPAELADIVLQRIGK